MRKLELKYILDNFGLTGMNTIQDFEWVQNPDLLSITYKREPRLYFQLSTSPKSFNSFQTKWTSYSKHYPEQADTNYINSKAASMKLNEWVGREIKNYLKEADLPDPLEELKRQARINFEFTDQDEQERFTEEYKTTLKLKLAEFKAALEESIPLNEEGRKVQDEQFEYIETKLDELNKRDFKAVAKQFIYDLSINVAANVIVDVGAAVVAAQYNETFWQIFKKVFGFVLQLNS